MLFNKKNFLDQVVSCLTEFDDLQVIPKLAENGAIKADKESALIRLTLLTG